MPRINLVAAVAQNGVIGNGNRLPWHIPSDFRFFKSLTLGHTLIMGRHTLESIPQRRLKGRHIIVLTGGGGMNSPDVTYVHSIDEALRCPHMSNDLFVAGGTTVYRAFFPRASRVYITEVCAEVTGDTYFPERAFLTDAVCGNWTMTHRGKITQEQGDQYPTRHLIFDRE